MLKNALFLIIGIVISAAVFYFAFIRSSASDIELIRKYVIDPVPKSLWNIKVVQTKDIGGYGYIFGFKINEDDLKTIIQSRLLKKASYHDYDGTYIGIIYDGSNNSDSELLFQPGYGIKEPRWFKLRKWDYPSTHALRRDNSYEILLYNKSKSTAYFCMRSWK